MSKKTELAKIEKRKKPKAVRRHPRRKGHLNSFLPAGGGISLIFEFAGIFLQPPPPTWACDKCSATLQLSHNAGDKKKHVFCPTCKGEMRQISGPFQGDTVEAVTAAPKGIEASSGSVNKESPDSRRREEK